MAQTNGVDDKVEANGALVAKDPLPPVTPLPQPNIKIIQSGVSLLEPLSRLGKGPGVIIVVPSEVQDEDNLSIKNGVPSAMLKWAEEGYVVAQVTSQSLSGSGGSLRVAVEAIARCPKCDSAASQGLIVYDPTVWNLIVDNLYLAPAIVAAAVYSDVTIASRLAHTSIPAIQHLSGKSDTKLIRSEDLTQHGYPGTSSHLFATPFGKAFDYANEAVSHTRNLRLLKHEMDGPHFDLEAIWDEHAYYEFQQRSVEHTMSTMVAEPYVNHIPTIAGGIGRTPLTTFYAHHFIFNNPADTEMELISRTVGIDRVVDEFIFKFCHDKQIDWLLPGVPATGRRVEIPFTAVVNIRGDRLFHEHIAWDQASVLRQLSLLPQSLPWPYPHPEGKTPAPGKRFEYVLPVVGVQTAEKMRDKNAVESNRLFEGGIIEVDE